MSINQNTSFRNALVVHTLIFGTSLLAAYVLYGVLKSTGTFENKGAQLGGAAAGFVIVFLLSSSVFSNMLKRLHDNQKDSESEDAKITIKRLQATIDELISVQFSPGFIPAGFAGHTAREEGLAYAYPIDWQPKNEKSIGQYFRSPIQSQGKPELFNGNIMVTIVPISSAPSGQPQNQESIDAILDANRDGVAKLYSAQNVTSEKIFVAGLAGRRYRGNFIHFESKAAVSFDLILVLEPQSSRLFCFSLYERTELIEAASAKLLTLVATAKIRIK